MASTYPCVADWIWSTSWRIHSVAAVVSFARSFTSSATTAKPRPAEPARAASIAAFRANRLVCSAMPVITETTSPILALLSPSRATVSLVAAAMRSEEHTSELQSLMRISYAVFCLKKKKHTHYKEHKHRIHIKQLK